MSSEQLESNGYSLPSEPTSDQNSEAKESSQEHELAPLLEPIFAHLSKNELLKLANSIEDIVYLYEGLVQLNQDTEADILDQRKIFGIRCGRVINKSKEAIVWDARSKVADIRMLLIEDFGLSGELLKSVELIIQYLVDDDGVINMDKITEVEGYIKEVASTFREEWREVEVDGEVIRVNCGETSFSSAGRQKTLVLGSTFCLIDETSYEFVGRVVTDDGVDLKREDSVVVKDSNGKSVIMPMQALEEEFAEYGLSQNTAREIMGEDKFFGSVEVSKALGWEVKSGVYPILFSREELEKAANQGLYLIFRSGSTDRIPKYPKQLLEIAEKRAGNTLVSPELKRKLNKTEHYSNVYSVNPGWYLSGSIVEEGSNAVTCVEKLTGYVKKNLDVNSSKLDAIEELDSIIDRYRHSDEANISELRRELRESLFAMIFAAGQVDEVYDLLVRSCTEENFDPQEFERIFLKIVDHDRDYRDLSVLSYKK